MDAVKVAISKANKETDLAALEQDLKWLRDYVTKPAIINGLGPLFDAMAARIEYLRHNSPDKYESV